MILYWIALDLEWFNLVDFKTFESTRFNRLANTVLEFLSYDLKCLTVLVRYLSA